MAPNNKEKRTIYSKSEQSSRAEGLPACSRAERHPAPCSSAEPGIHAAHLVTHVLEAAVTALASKAGEDVQLLVKLQVETVEFTF